MRILINDKISASGVEALEKAGHQVFLVNVAQNRIPQYINEHEIEVLLVRSATKVGKDIIDNCPSLKIIGRGGVGMDNIEVDYAQSKGIHVINTPEASAASVAELVFAHLFGAVRFLYDSNRNMPLEGDSHFKELKKYYSSGKELRGKTIGLIGFGKIAQEVAKIAIGCGMKVLINRKNQSESNRITLEFFDSQQVSFNLPTHSFEDVLRQSDFISIHVPAEAGTLFGEKELKMMKPGAGLINSSRGNTVDEEALLEALDEEKLSFAALDVYKNEPSPSSKLLMHPKISLSPHIGASTDEAQDRIGLELANQIDRIAENFNY